MKTRQVRRDCKSSNNLKKNFTFFFIYSFAAFTVVRAYKYLLILYVYACAFKRARGKGLEKLTIHRIGCFSDAVKCIYLAVLMQYLRVQLC